MKKLYILLTLSVILASCEEWQPVGILKYPDVDVYEKVTLTPTHTIAQLKQLYTAAGYPVKIESLQGVDIIIGGQVVSDDRSGNIYRSLYIQDASGAIELKVGKTGMYNDYKLGQWVYVKCTDLVLGNYRGMLQLGLASTDTQYETAYIDIPYIIDTHIFRGELDDPIPPKELAMADLVNTSDLHNPLLGTYVTIKGLKYGCKPDGFSNPPKKIFCLLYIDQNEDTKSQSNRIFLSDDTYNVTTWAMSKVNFRKHIKAGDFDSAKIADGSGNLDSEWQGLGRTVREQLYDYNPSAYTVSQYFLLNDVIEVQIRTSGYAKFADKEINENVLAQEATIDASGILTIYEEGWQLAFLDLDTGLKVNK